MATSFSVELRKLRLGLYTLLALLTFFLLALCATRINYTTNLPAGDTLNGGWDFTDPSVAELLFTSIITLLFVPAMMFIIIRRYEHSIVSRTWFEVAGLILLWFFWLGGTVAATDDWPADLLARCSTRFSQCRELQALVAFAWLGWITLSVLLAGTIYSAVTRKSWPEHIHSEEGPVEPRFAFEGTPVTQPTVQV